MYNCMKHDTGSAVARVTKDRAARSHLPSTVKNQLGRRRQRRQLLTIGQWNVRTFLDREGANRPERRTALVAMELAKYNIDIAALCETRFSESDSLNDLEYSFFWSGKPEGERREAGVGFAIKKDIVTKLTEMPRPVSDRIMTMRLPLSKDNFATIISVYAPTMTYPDENKEAFYNQLAGVLSGIPRTDKLLLIGDFNARIGRDNDKWPLVMGKHGIGKCNSNGELLLALCSEFELIVTNTMFKQKDERKTTWMHPRSKHWHMIDFHVPGDIDHEALDNIPQRITKTSLDEIPTMDEMARAIASLKDGKAPGGDGIPAEVWKHGGDNLFSRRHQLITNAWEMGSVSQAWKDASIITIYKKGDRTDCGNYRGISLLSIAGKIFARILLNRLSTHLTPEVVPETQCGFRGNRSTVDMIFCLRQLQEKCI